MTTYCSAYMTLSSLSFILQVHITFYILHVVKIMGIHSYILILSFMLYILSRFIIVKYFVSDYATFFM